ncbi:BON domain-containing protein [Microvirga sp. 2TAF3]|uniref:BON domain-containing protein n=1 Tax=Microvirga sp. 2TAF3 TaxID=3233014 RepID=UPI003F9C224D
MELEFKWDSDIDATDIGVSVKNGAVTLTGFVKNFNEEWEAESDAKRVAGIVGVATDSEICPPYSCRAASRLAFKSISLRSKPIRAN